MTEVRQAREVDLVPQELRFVPQVKSDIIIQRRNVSLAPIEAANTYTRNGTNTITFNVQGHKELSQLLDAKSVYFQMQCRFNNAYPSEDVSMLFEEVIISSNGRTIERIRDAQYIQKFLRGYGMSRDAKARLGKREGFQQYEDCTVQMTSNAIAPPDPVGNGDVADAAGIVAAVNALRAPTQHGYGYKKAATTATAPVVGAAAGGAAAHAAGDDGFTDIVGDTAWPTANITRMSANLGYLQKQVNRTPSGAAPAGGVWGGCGLIENMAPDGWHLMKFRLPCSGLLNSEKMLPIMSMPLTIQLRLSDPSRCCDKQQGADNFDYEIRRPRMRMQVCSVGQAYASAMTQRLRGPGITLNCKMFDTYFQIINEDRQIVIPSNKQRLSKVYVMLHNEASTNARNQDAFRSSDLLI